MIDLNEVKEYFEYVLPVRGLIVLEEDVEHVKYGALELILELLKTILFLLLILRVVAVASTTSARASSSGPLLFFFHTPSLNESCCLLYIIKLFQI